MKDKTFYNHLRKLEKLEIIKKVKNGKNKNVLMNPYFIGYGTNCTDESLMIFSNSIWSKQSVYCKKRKEKGVDIMTKEYPYILLIRLLSFFNYKSGILQFNGKNITVNQISHLLGLNSKTFHQAIDVLKKNNLSEILEISGNKIVLINNRIIDGIEDSKMKKSKFN